MAVGLLLVLVLVGSLALFGHVTADRIGPRDPSGGSSPSDAAQRGPTEPPGTVCGSGQPCRWPSRALRWWRRCKPG